MKKKIVKEILLNQFILKTSIDWSKVSMLDFHYNYIKNKYGDKVEMLLVDPDSFMYKTEAENVYEDLVVGQMKDETCGVPVKDCRIKTWNVYFHNWRQSWI